MSIAEKFVLFILVVLVISMNEDIDKTVLVGAGALLAGVCLLLHQKEYLTNPAPKPHTCESGKEEQFIGSDLKTDPSHQDKDSAADYESIKMHSEDHQSKSYPVTHLAPAPLEQDKAITNYPFKMIDDKNGKVHVIYTQDEPSDEITEYAEDKDIYEMYKSQPYNGDSSIADRMKKMSDRSKESIVVRARMDKYTIAPFLEEELAQHANSRWWENNQDLEHMF